MSVLVAKSLKRIHNQLDSQVDTQMLFSSLIALALLLLSIKSFAAPIMINGAGATFPEPIYTKWFSEIQKKDTSININYQGVGSGGGIRQLTAGTVDFGASDAPMTADELKTIGKDVVHIPTVLGAVVVSYNINLEKPLKLTGSTVAEIFNGKITKWNDAKIAATNPGVKLPEQAIIVATRSDGSGTTAVFTDYLAKISPDWTGKAGKTVDWFKGSIAAKGNAGVAGLIKQNVGTVGYVELVYAMENKLAYAHIQNKEGQFIEPSLKSITAAAAKSVPEMLKNDFKVSITNVPGKDSYPISTYTWLLITNPTSKEKGKKIIDMVKWSLGDSGQKMAEELHYARLPKDLTKKVLEKVSKIKLD